MPGKILLVDDDDDVREAVEAVLRDAGNEVLSCGSGDQALRVLANAEIDVVVTDMRMPSVDGIRVCEHVANNYPCVPAIVMTAYGDLPTAIEAIRAAAFDLLRKPFPAERLLEATESALSQRRSCGVMRRLREEPVTDDLPELIGTSQVMQDLRARLRRVACVEAATLITGESGTGKELIARALHWCSRRRSGPFVAVNCAAVPEGLLASELFGHERGAFTGAAEARPGLFEEANDGFLFLDEVASMPVDLQGALLRVLEDFTVRPVGGHQERRHSVRIVAATNRPLQEVVQSGCFREDLFFRLSSLNVHAPPLRERGDDVLELARHFIERIATKEGLEPAQLAPEAVNMLRRYRWPGNVRELDNAMQAAMAFARAGRIGLDELPAWISSRADGAPASSGSGEHSLEEVERWHIERVLGAVGGNKAEAARRLGIDRTTLYRKLKRLGLEGRARA